MDSGMAKEGIAPGDLMERFSAKFPDGHEIVIKVVNGCPPWIDAVLFQDGCLAYALKPTFLLGVYSFEWGHKKIEVRLTV